MLTPTVSNEMISIVVILFFQEKNRVYAVDAAAAVVFLWITK